MSTTKIEWATDVWNPVTGCDQVSEGCGLPRGTHGTCYALTLAKRLKAMGNPRYQSDGDPRTSGPGFGVTLHWDKLDEPLRARKPRRYFVNSMSDWLHPKVTDEFIARMWDTMVRANWHQFLLLTKREARLPHVLGPNGIGFYAAEGPVPRPQPNIWIGVSVEDQENADKRIPKLLRTPAAVRFLSCEPLLGPIDLKSYIGCRDSTADVGLRAATPKDQFEGSDFGPSDEGGKTGSGIGWVIVGGESGPDASPTPLMWVRSLVEQCRAAGVAVFVKQLGAHPIEEYGDYDELRLRSRKGGDPAEWPEDLRVREMPNREAVPA